MRDATRCSTTTRSAADPEAKGGRWRGGSGWRRRRRTPTPREARGTSTTGGERRTRQKGVAKFDEQHRWKWGAIFEPKEGRADRAVRRARCIIRGDFCSVEPIDCPTRWAASKMNRRRASVSSCHTLLAPRGARERVARMGCCVSRDERVGGEYASANASRREAAWKRTGVVGPSRRERRERPRACFAPDLAPTVRTLDASNNRIAALPPAVAGSRSAAPDPRVQRARDEAPRARRVRRPPRPRPRPQPRRAHPARRARRVDEAPDPVPREQPTSASSRPRSPRAPPSEAGRRRERARRPAPRARRVREARRDPRRGQPRAPAGRARRKASDESYAASGRRPARVGTIERRLAHPRPASDSCGRSRAESARVREPGDAESARVREFERARDGGDAGVRRVQAEGGGEARAASTRARNTGGAIGAEGLVEASTGTREKNESCRTRDRMGVARGGVRHEEVFWHESRRDERANRKETRCSRIPLKSRQISHGAARAASDRERTSPAARVAPRRLPLLEHARERPIPSHRRRDASAHDIGSLARSRAPRARGRGSPTLGSNGRTFAENAARAAERPLRTRTPRLRTRTRSNSPPRTRTRRRPRSARVRWTTRRRAGLQRHGGRASR